MHIFKKHGCGTAAGILLAVFVLMTGIMFLLLQVGFRLADGHPPVALPAYVPLLCVIGLFGSIACAVGALVALALQQSHSKAAEILVTVLLCLAVIFGAFVIIDFVTIQQITGTAFLLW